MIGDSHRVATVNGKPRRQHALWSRMWLIRGDLVGALLACVGLLIVFAPVLVGGKTLSSAAYTLTTNGFDPFPGQQPVGRHDAYRVDVSASALQFEPWAKVTASELRRGQLPLWNPYQGAGTPLAANMSSGVFDPLLLVVNLHPTQRAWDLTIVGVLLAGAVLTFVLCRVLGTGRAAAVTGATVYSLSGFFSLYSNNGYVRGYAYLPLLCLVVEWVIRSARLAPVVVLGVVTCGCITVGMPEITFFVLLTSTGWGLWRTWVGPRCRSRARCVGALAAGSALGLLLAAPLLALFLEYEGRAFTVHKGGGGSGSVTDPVGGLLGWVVPYLNGRPLSPVSGWSGTRNWIGAAAFVLVLFGLSATTAASKLVVPFFGCLTLLVLAKGYGLPALDWIGRLPVMDRVILPPYAFPVVGFTVALVAAAGVDGIRRRSVGWATLCIAACCSGLAVVALRLSDRRLFVSLGRGGLDDLVMALAAMGAVLLAVIVLKPRLAAAAAAGVVVLELVVLAPNTFAQRADPFRSPDWLATMQAQLRERPFDRVFGLDASLYPNTAGAYGLFDIRMLDALYLYRFYRYLRAFIDPAIPGRFMGTHWGSEELAPAYRDNQMFDLLGVRYIVARQDAPSAGLSALVSPISLSDSLAIRVATVAGQARPAIVQTTPHTVPLLLPRPFAGRLSFAYGVEDPTGAAAFFVDAQRRSGTRETLWKDVYAPTDGQTPAWRSAAVDVPTSADPIIGLELRTESLAGRALGGAAVSELTVQETGRPPGFQFTPITSSGNTFVLENSHALPRAFLVHDVQAVPDLDAAEQRFAQASDHFGNGALRVKDIDVTKEAVVEASPQAIPSELRSGHSCRSVDHVTITSYEADEVRLEASSPCPSLLVLSDTYFPGWGATVNGKAVEIYPTDLALRGVVLPAGRSEIVFRYRPSTFRDGIWVAFAAITGTTALAIVLSIRRRRSLVLPTRSDHEPPADVDRTLASAPIAERTDQTGDSAAAVTASNRPP